MARTTLLLRLLTASLFACSTAVAQDAPAPDAAPDGWYIQPQVSVGLAHQFVNTPLTPFYANGTGLHLGAGALVGKSFGRWQGETGLLFWQNQTAYERQALVFGSQFDPASGQLTSPATQIGLQERYRHLVVPLRVGYNLTPHAKTAIRPVAGVLLSYNTQHDVRYDTDTTSADDGFFDSHQLGNGLQRVSVWGNLGVQVQVGLSRRTAVVLGADAACMLTSFSGSSPISQRSFVLSFSAGFRGLF